MGAAERLINLQKATDSTQNFGFKKAETKTVFQYIRFSKVNKFGQEPFLVCAILNNKNKSDRY